MLFKLSPITKKCLNFIRSSSTENNSYDFGFKRTTHSEKTQRVNKFFDGAADTYDILNDVISLGMHRLWKNMFIHQIGILLIRFVGAVL